VTSTATYVLLPTGVQGLFAHRASPSAERTACSILSLVYHHTAIFHFILHVEKQPLLYVTNKGCHFLSTGRFVVRVFPQPARPTARPPKRAVQQ
jgi:hypothetical protein